jgi:hypothetical protein
MADTVALYPSEDAMQALIRDKIARITGMLAQAVAVVPANASVGDAAASEREVAGRGSGALVDGSSLAASRASSGEVGAASAPVTPIPTAGLASGGRSVGSWKFIPPLAETAHAKRPPTAAPPSAHSAPSAPPTSEGDAGKDVPGVDRPHTPDVLGALPLLVAQQQQPSEGLEALLRTSVRELTASMRV